MKNPFRPSLSAGLLLGAWLAVACHAALTPTEWQHRQTVNVTSPGLAKLVLPPATFDAAQTDLSDLRLLDAAGQEVPYVLDREGMGRIPARPAATLRPASFRADANGDTTQLLLQTGTPLALDAIELETSVPFFLKAAHVEISSNGTDWESLGAATPVFRQFGAEQLRLALNHRPAAFVRVTLDDFRSRAIAFTGANVIQSATRTSPPPPAPLGASVARREEFAGETVFTVLLDGRHVLLAGLEFETPDALFMRRVSVAVREVRDTVSSERVIATGTIYRVALDGAAPRTQLAVPLEFIPLSRELLVHVHNGDSPPLAIERVKAQQHPVNLLFLAAKEGGFTLLTGNPQAAPPRYDLAAFAGEMRGAGATVVTSGDVEAMPDYHPRESLAAPTLPDVPLAGAPLDATAWLQHRPLQITRAGVQELELDPATLARSRADFGDLRILRNGNQIPYVLEQPALARSLTLTPVAVPDAKHPSVSVWRLSLPEANLPLRRVILSSDTPLFQRQLRVYEKLTDQNGTAYENVCAVGMWGRTPDPGVPETRVFDLPGRIQGSTLFIETDNGDNPPIALKPVQVAYPVVRLIFKTAETDGFTLAAGNENISAPRYDLSLVAGKLVTSSRNVAQFATGSATATAAKTSDALGGGLAFWLALALVVAVLLVVVAKLLPKPPAPPAG